MRLVDKHRAGFTLLEALVALAILTGATASLMVLIATNKRVQAEASSELSAVLHARSILARIGRDIPLKAGAHSGILESGHAWSVLITPFTLEHQPATGENSSLFQIIVRLKRGLAGPLLIEVISLKRAPR